MRQLLTPTVFIIASLALLAWLVARRREPITAILAWALFGIGYLLTSSLAVGVIARAWQVPRAPLCEQPPAGSVIVVLTGGASGAARSPNDVELLSQPTYRRLLAAVELASSAESGRLIVSGGAEVGTVTEASIATEFVRRQGWDMQQFEVEDRSSDTLTSAIEVRRLLSAHEIPRHVLLVTSATHMRRSQYVFAKAGIHTVACACDFTELFPMLPDGLLPSGAALQKAGEVWKEMVGYIVYHARSIDAPRVSS